MQEVPETVNKAVERQEDGLEDFLKQWRKGQDKQFKLFSILKGAVVKPFEIAKIGMSAAEKAQATFKMVKESVEQALGKGAAIKVIFKQLADAFPFIGKIRDKIIDFENLIPNMVEFVSGKLDNLSKSIKYAIFNLRGSYLNTITQLPVFGKKEEKLHPKDLKILKDWQAINGTREIAEAEEKRRSAISKFASNTLTQKRFGIEFTQEELDEIKEGNGDLLASKLRENLKKKNSDPEFRAVQQLEELIEQLSDTSSDYYTTLGKDRVEEIQSAAKTLVLDKYGRNPPKEAATHYEYLLSTIRDQASKAQNQPQVLQSLSKLRDTIEAINRTGKVPGNYLAKKSKVADYDQMDLNKLSNALSAAYHDPLEHSAGDTGIPELTKLIKTYAKQDAEATKLRLQQDPEETKRVMEEYELEQDAKGHIKAKQKDVDWEKIKEKNRETVKEGTQKLQDMMGGPDFGSARANQFVKDMIMKYHLPWDTNNPEFIDTFFWIKRKDNKPDGTIEEISIRDQAVTKWLEEHPEAGFTTWHEYTDAHGDKVRILSERDALKTLTSDGKNGWTYSNIYGNNAKLITRNQGSNAWREFDDDGEAVDLPDYNDEKVDPYSLPVAKGHLEEDYPSIEAEIGTNELEIDQDLIDPEGKYTPEQLKEMREHYKEAMRNRNKAETDYKRSEYYYKCLEEIYNGEYNQAWDPEAWEKDTKLSQKIREVCERYDDEFKNEIRANKVKPAEAYVEYAKQKGLPPLKVLMKAYNNIYNDLKETVHHKEDLDRQEKEAERQRLEEEAQAKAHQKAIEDEYEKYKAVFGPEKADNALEYAKRMNLDPLMVLKYQQEVHYQSRYETSMKRGDDPSGAYAAEAKETAEDNAIQEVLDTAATTVQTMTSSAKKGSANDIYLPRESRDSEFMKKHILTSDQFLWAGTPYASQALKIDNLLELCEKNGIHVDLHQILSRLKPIAVKNKLDVYDLAIQELERIHRESLGSDFDLETYYASLNQLYNGTYQNEDRSEVISKDDLVTDVQRENTVNAIQATIDNKLNAAAAEVQNKIDQARENELFSRSDDKLSDVEKNIKAMGEQQLEALESQKADILKAIGVLSMLMRSIQHGSSVINVNQGSSGDSTSEIISKYLAEMDIDIDKYIK
ncbi:MAG: hypothetical protein J6Z28_08450 [Succinivibrio sp.]|nr:hypothetical protein [Succinivibrio sp.]